MRQNLITYVIISVIYILHETVLYQISSYAIRVVKNMNNFKARLNSSS